MEPGELLGLWEPRGFFLGEEVLLFHVRVLIVVA